MWLCQLLQNERYFILRNANGLPVIKNTDCYLLFFVCLCFIALIMLLIRLYLSHSVNNHQILFNLLRYVVKQITFVNICTTLWLNLQYLIYLNWRIKYGSQFAETMPWYWIYQNGQVQHCNVWLKWSKLQSCYCSVPLLSGLIIFSFMMTCPVIFKTRWLWWFSIKKFVQVYCFFQSFLSLFFLTGGN